MLFIDVDPRGQVQFLAKQQTERSVRKRIIHRDVREYVPGEFLPLTVAYTGNAPKLVGP
jgi:hypothetical protein